jgi:hypothetical protein
MTLEKASITLTNQKSGSTVEISLLRSLPNGYECGSLFTPTIGWLGKTWQIRTTIAVYVPYF